MENETIATSYPDFIPINVLKKKHKEFKDTSKVDDFYEAGEDFPAGKYLRYRDLEGSSKPIGPKLRKARVAAATLEPVLSGVVDFLTGATIKSKLNILAAEDSTSYYHELNEYIGKTQRELLRKGILHNRSYILISFPNGSINNVTLDQQKKAKELNAELTVIPANTVIDWRECNGVLDFAKTYSICSERSNPDNIWEEPDIEVHEWTFFTENEIATYKAETPIVDGVAKAFDDEATAELIDDVVPHSLGACPMVLFSPSSKIINRVLPIADAHFNRTSSLTFSLDNSAWSMPVITKGLNQTNLDEMLCNEMVGLVLENGGSVSSYGPNSSQNFTALADNAEYLAMQLFKVIQAASLNSYQTGQNTSRLSAAARRHEASYMEILLASYGDDLEETYRKVVSLITKARQDEIEITYSGADDYNAESLAQSVDFVAKLLDLDIPNSAKKYALSDIANKVVSAAPANIRNEVAKESANIDLESVDTTIEINGAVAQGITQLVDRDVITLEEGRLKLGFPADKPESKLKIKTPEIPDNNIQPELSNSIKDSN